MMHAVDELGDFVKNRSTRLPSEGQPLPEGLRWAIEWLSGYDMSDVRVYYASDAPARVGARALAQGSDIYVQSGAEETLPHEVWHVVQQMQGRVEATIEVNGRLVNDDPLLEKEADEMGAMAAALSWSGMWRRVKGVLTKGRIEKPVVQRIVTIGADVLGTAQAVRDKLNESQNVNADNTPHLVAVVNTIFARNPTFDNLLALKREVKQRSFGMRHVEAMEALLAQQQDLIRTYVTTNYPNRNAAEATTDLVAKVTAIVKASGSPATLKRAAQKLPNPLTFIRWSSATTLLKITATKAAREADFYKWLRDNVAPLAMNCWENTIYSGAWTNEDARTSLYSKAYVIWALQDRETLKLSYADPDNAKSEKLYVPHYVKHVIDDSTHHETDRDANRKARKLPAPTNVEPGNIVVLNCGGHVALATGRMCNVFTNEAREEYGQFGHEIIELDGWTNWMVRGTIEDCIAFGGYNAEWHLGWMPEIEQRTSIALTDKATSAPLIEVEVTANRFYS